MFFWRCFFSVYMFEYMVTGTLMNRGATGFLSPAVQVRLYYIDMACCTLGFAAFAAVRQIVRQPKSRTVLMFLIALLFTAGVCCCFFIPAKNVYRYIAPVTMFCLGMMGGMAYTIMSVSLVDSGCTGRVMGIGGAAAVLLQYILQLKFDISFAMLFILVAGLVIMAWLLHQFQWDQQISGNFMRGTHTVGDDRSIRFSLACAVVITALLILLLQYYDSKMEALAVSSGFVSVNLYTLPRLFVIVAFLGAGFLGDIQNGKYVPLFTLCAMLVSVLIPALPAGKGSYTVGMCLFYFNLGVIVAYYNLTFWKLAPRTDCPELWAGMGRILDGATGVAVYLLHLENFSVPVIIGIDLVMLICVIAAMAFSGDFTLSAAPVQAEEPEPEKEPDPKPVDAFEVLCERYQFTPREKEVLQKLLMTEDELQPIADSLFISRRVLSRHISSIYQKTGVKSRIGLYRLYNAVSQES